MLEARETGGVRELQTRNRRERIMNCWSVLETRQNCWSWCVRDERKSSMSGIRVL